MRFNLPPIRTMATKLTLAFLAMSVIAGLTQNSIAIDLLLSPLAVLHRFFLWQLLTYGLVALDAMGVIFGALIIWQLGGALEQSWGPGRLLRFALGIIGVSGALTVLTAVLIPSLQEHVFFGGFELGTALWVAYGLSYGQAQTNFWGIPVTGHVFALIGIGFVVLNGLFGHWVPMIPSLFAIGLTWLYMKGFTRSLGLLNPRMAWLRFQSWRFKREMKSRASHLRVISKERNMPADSDRYLH